MPDLTKLIAHSSYPAFKNMSEYTGSFDISGTIVPGVNVRSYFFDLPYVPAIEDIVFSGRGEQGFSSPDFGTNPRPSGTWFKEGAVFVRGDNAGDGYINEGTMWVINASINGKQLTITAICVIQFYATLTLTTETVQIKLVDYIST